MQKHLPVKYHFSSLSLIKHLLLFSFLLFSSHAKTQQYTISANNGVLSGEKIYTTRTGDMLLCGITNAYQNQNSLFVSRFNKDLSVVWSKIYFDLNSELHYTGTDDTLITNIPHAAFIIPIANEKEFIIGGSYDSSSVITITGGPILYSLIYQKGFLSKVDENGNLLWCRKYEIDNSSAFTCGVANPYNENEFFVAGYHNNNGYQDISVLKVNGSGDILSKNGFGSPVEEGVSQISVSPEKKLVLTGTTNTDSRNIFYAETDIESLTVSAVIFLKAGPFDFSKALKVLPDNSKLILAQTGSGVPSFISLIKLNSDNSIAWAKKMGYSSTDLVHDLETDNSGHIIIGGMWSDFFAKDFDYLFLKCHSNGELFYSGRLGYHQVLNSKERISDMVISGNGIFIAGNSDSAGLTQNKSYLVKLNSNSPANTECNLQPLDYTSTSFSITITTGTFSSYSLSVNSFIPVITTIISSQHVQQICNQVGGNMRDDIIVYPVPFKDKLFIHSGLYAVNDLSFTLYDAIGRRLISKKLTSDQLFWDNQPFLSSGYYIVVISKGNEILKRVPVIKRGE